MRSGVSAGKNGLGAAGKSIAVFVCALLNVTTLPDPDGNTAGDVLTVLIGEALASYKSVPKTIPSPSAVKLPLLKMPTNVESGGVPMIDDPVPS